MKISSAFLVLGSAVTAFGGSAAMGSGSPQGECEVTRILPGGREVRSKGKAASFVRRDGASSHASGVATSSGRSSARSSVSVSSSSSGSGRGHARAVTSYTNEQGHQVTTSRDETGCKITVDEREATDTGEE